MTHRIPRGPRELPVLGSLPFASRDMLGFITRLRDRYGDVAQWHMGKIKLYLLSHPDDIEDLLVGRRDLVKDLLTRELSTLLGQGLLTSEGELWRRQRKLAAPAFQRGHVSRYASTMAAVAAETAGSWRDGAVVDIHAEMMRLTLEIATLTLFGVSSGQHAGAVGHAVEQAMHQFEREARSLLRFVPRTVKTPGRRRFEHAVRTIDETVFGIIEAHRKGGGVEGTLLARLLAARDEEGNPMSDQQLRDEAVTLFLAGHETTALALTFALRLLARHPHVAAALRAELDRVLGGRAPTADDLPALPYADAVIRESMRLYPPAYAMGRETLQDMEIAGHFAPAGTQLVVSPWVVHRDPRWFPDPKRFAPERWLEGRAQGLHRFAYFPFGGGPRVCIGNHFAMLEAVIVLATLASRWAVEPVPGAPLRLLPSVTLRPIGEVPVRLRSLDGGPLAA